MKKLVFTLLLMFPIVCQAQTEESKYYIYNIVSFVGDFTKENFKEALVKASELRAKGKDVALIQE